MSKNRKPYPKTSWVDARIEVRDSSIAGKGGFAREFIREGEIVAVIGGTVFTEEEFKEFAKTASQYDAIQIGEALHLVDLSPDSRANNGSFNHSCDSILWMQDENTLVARRDIQADEEVTVDYALFTALPGEIIETSCRCSSASCRQSITGEDWKLADVQKQYQGHFSPFINTRITNII